MAGFLHIVIVLSLVVLSPHGTSVSDDETGKIDKIELDILFTNGEIIDPESESDFVGHVGVSNDKIVFVSKSLPDTAQYSIKNTVDISGLVLCPGFIDIHAHHQSYESNTFSARDGVTTSLELEIGAFPIDRWYERRIEDIPALNGDNNDDDSKNTKDNKRGKTRKGSLLNYGASVGHIPVRMYENGIKDEIPFITIFTLPDGVNNAWSTIKYPNLSEIESKILKNIEDGLNEGALGIGMGIAYTPGATEFEIYNVFKLASRLNTTLFIHIREANNLPAINEMISNTISTDSSTHIMHIGSSGGDKLETVLEMIFGAIKNSGNRLKLTTEIYPYTAASTFIESHLFDKGWQERLGITYKDLQYIETGEYLTEELFNKYRNKGGLLVIHSMKEEIIELGIEHPEIMIASDGLPFLKLKNAKNDLQNMKGVRKNINGHPRASGTFTRILGKYVREKKILNLMDAIKKMTYYQAKLLSGISKDFENKGKITVGADADITIFDKENVRDMSTYMHGAIPSEGIIHVLVNGVFVVKDESVVENVFPGRPMRGNLYYQNQEKLKSKVNKKEL